MLRQKELFHISEKLKQIEGNNLVSGELCVVLVGDSVQLPPVLAESLWVKGLPSTSIDDRNGNNICMYFSDLFVLKKTIDWMRRIQKV